MYRTAACGVGRVTMGPENGRSRRKDYFSCKLYFIPEPRSLSEPNQPNVNQQLLMRNLSIKGGNQNP